MKPHIHIIFLLSVLLSAPTFAAPWHQNCKIWRGETNLVKFSDYEQLAIKKFIKHTNHKILIAEICTVEDGEKEIFFAIERNVAIPPAPGSNTMVIIKKNANRSTEIFDGR